MSLRLDSWFSVTSLNRSSPDPFRLDPFSCWNEYCRFGFEDKLKDPKCPFYFTKLCSVCSGASVIS